MSAQGRELVVGGEPRIDLLPPEVRAHAAGKKMVAKFGVAVLLVLALAAAATALSMFQTFQSQQALDAVQLRSQALLTDHGSYAKVSTIKGQLDTVKAAQQVGASTEIDLQDYLISVQKATAEAGLTIGNVNFTVASPIELFPQSPDPLQGQRIATLTLQATGPGAPSVATWLESLKRLNGFVDASAGPIALAPNGSYSVDLTMHVNQDAYLKRFAEKGK